MVARTLLTRYFALLRPGVCSPKLGILATCSGVAVSFGHFFRLKLAKRDAARGSTGKSMPSRAAMGCGWFTRRRTLAFIVSSL